MKNKKLIVASGNNGKIKEIKNMLTGFEIFGYKDLGFDFDIRETGNSFYENALIKAMAVYEKVGCPVLADDSGLMVDALNGAPGIFSARYSGDGVDAHNVSKLLNELDDKPNRNAKFVCCMVYFDGKKIITETGETYGKILTETEGSNGFGYDPVFYSNELKKSFGRASAQEKDKVSHRACAIKKIKERLNDL